MKNFASFFGGLTTALPLELIRLMGIVLLVSTLSSMSLSNACTLSITPPPPITAVYDPYEATPLLIAASIQVKRSGSDRCNPALAVGNVPSASQAPASIIRFAILDGSGTVAFDSSQLQTQAALLRQASSSSADQSIPVVIRILPGQMAAPGTHPLQIVVTPVSASDMKQTAAGPPATLSVLLTVAPALSVNVAGGGQTVTVDFGVLTAGATRSVSLQARSNQRFALVASSDNGGVLRLTSATKDSDWQVPYTIRFGNGQSYNLSGGRIAKLIQKPTPLTGAVTPLDVTVGDPSRQRAGVYKDIITVLVAPEP